jgi:hypothetical protein
LLSVLQTFDKHLRIDTLKRELYLLFHCFPGVAVTNGARWGISAPHGRIYFGNPS